jgi:hypothetical protein
MRAELCGRLADEVDQGGVMSRHLMTSTSLEFDALDLGN